MIITCPACATQFREPDGALGSDGRKLRCSSCRHLWFQTPPEAEADAPEAPTPTVSEHPEPAAAAETAAPPATPDTPEDEASEQHRAPAAELSPTVDAAPDEPAAPLPPVEESLAATVETVPCAPEESVAQETFSEAGESPDAATQDDEAEELQPQAETPAAPETAASTTREPGAATPRDDQEKPAAHAPRSGLRLVGKAPEEEPAAATQLKAAPAAPSFDVTRVVTPDSAPEGNDAPAPRKRRSGLILVLLLLLAVVAGAYFERTQVMRFLPQTASLYGMLGLVGAPSAQGLQLLDVAFRVEEVGGTPSLIVSGKVMNVSREYRLIPELRVMLLNEEGNATESWALRATAEGLAPGATAVFEAVYPDPPRTGEDKDFGLTFADLI